MLCLCTRCGGERWKETLEDQGLCARRKKKEGRDRRRKGRESEEEHSGGKRTETDDIEDREVKETSRSLVTGYLLIPSYFSTLSSATLRSRSAKDALYSDTKIWKGMRDSECIWRMKPYSFTAEHVDKPSNEVQLSPL